MTSVEHNQFDPEIMRDYKKKTMRIYKTWGILTIIIIVALFILPYRNLIGGFIVGSIVNLGLISHVMYAFNVALKEGADYRTRITTGPLPKAALMIVGVLICLKFPDLFNTIGYVIGIALYAIVFAINSFLEYKEGKEKNSG